MSIKSCFSKIQVGDILYVHRREDLSMTSSHFSVSIGAFPVIKLSYDGWSYVASHLDGVVCYVYKDGIVRIKKKK